MGQFTVVGSFFWLGVGLRVQVGFQLSFCSWSCSAEMVGAEG